ncbi:TetR/AcrR family transcriptional regulator [Paludisphaera rhizosphaerae]|uniref:TetR/AcrR family transcriptional regulator n=1 Tax=Paludisphaera rhizosphaerae TaxID=2711216 RepID=UPI0013ED3A06|nr:TetR/AcrR family transcriptional regulator [Paludisphaera rhizosphaerae]
MPADGEPSPSRRPRADAERNRVRLLADAKAVFAEKGAAASLEEIARRAGVGIGTLYRHFPTRDALIAAVYRNEIEQLIAAAERLAAEAPPVEALREWMLLFVDYLGTKHGMSEVLKSVAGGPSEIYAAFSARITETIGTLVERASGKTSPDLEPLDLLRALAGVAHAGSGPDGKRAAQRLVDILVAGLLAQNQAEPAPIKPPARRRGR